MAALVSRLQVSLIAASFSVVLLFVIAFYSFGYSPQPFDRPMDRRREIRYSFAFGRKLLAQGISRSDGPYFSTYTWHASMRSSGVVDLWFRLSLCGIRWSPPKWKFLFLCQFCSPVVYDSLVCVLLTALVQNAGATVPSTTEVNNGTAATKPNRIGEGCSPGDLVLYQAATTPLPSGIPTYTVQILNECLGGGDCRIGHIHLSCGWFSSARLVNPRVFRRLRFNDCLVNDGRPIANGQSISFQYANTFRYPLSVSSATCLSSTSTATSP